ncbi:MAG: hypothetical protein Q9175_008312 [Cornicularia normoerica]
MINLIDENGTLLIIGIEKWDYDCSKDAAEHCPGFPHEGLEVTGRGSKDIVKTLQDLGMENIAVIGDRCSRLEAKHGSGPDPPTMKRKEMYFVLKARGGRCLRRSCCRNSRAFTMRTASLKPAVKAGRHEWEERVLIKGKLARTKQLERVLAEVENSQRDRELLTSFPSDPTLLQSIIRPCE